ncbi:MAG: HEAT repeat domain-containing protein [Phycisphaerales bacterium]
MPPPGSNARAVSTNPPQGEFALLWLSREHMLGLMIGRRLLGVPGLLLLCSCGPAMTEGGFDAASPAARSYAIEQAARAGDLDAVPKIVEQLDADDPAIRMLAIDALHRLTGETYGFHHYDPPHERHDAIQRWVTAVQSGAVPHPIGSADDSRETP